MASLLRTTSSGASRLQPMIAPVPATDCRHSPSAMAFVPAVPAALRSSSLHGTAVCAAPPPAVASGRIPFCAAADGARGKATSRGDRSSRKPRATDAPTFAKDLKGRILWSIRRATPDDVPAMQRLSGDAALPATLLRSLVEAKTQVCLVAEAPVMVAGGSTTQTGGGGASRAMARPTERTVAVPASDTAAAAKGGNTGADADASKTVSSGSTGGSQSRDHIVGAAVADVSLAVRPGGNGLCKVGNLISVVVDDRMEAAVSSDGAAAVSVKKVLGLAALRAMKLADVELVSAEKKVDSPEAAYLMSLGYTEDERTSKDGKRVVQLTCNLVAANPDPGKKIFD